MLSQRAQAPKPFIVGTFVLCHAYCQFCHFWQKSADFGGWRGFFLKKTQNICCHKELRLQNHL